MATKFRIAAIALSKVHDYETAKIALDRCLDEYARGGSMASAQMVEKARVAVAEYAPR